MFGKEYLSAFGAWIDPKGHKYFTYERNRGCNLHCQHCKVWQLYDRDTELTLEQSFKVYDRLYEFGYFFGTALGGEPLLSLRTKDGLTFYEQTRREIRYAKRLGMVIGLSTNGTYFTASMADDLKKDGLDWITLSPHKNTRAELNYLVSCGQMAARRGIVPVMHFLATKYNIDSLPESVAYVVKHGILPAVTIVQEKGVNFSNKPANPADSLIPGKEQQEVLFDVLADFKLLGWEKNNRKLLKEAPNHYPNSWKCDPARDTFLHIGAGGTLDVCEEVRTDLTIFDVKDLNDPRWKERKEKLVGECTGCLYRCYYESENPDIKGDITTMVVVGLIKAGRVGLISKLTVPLIRGWGQLAARMVYGAEA